MSTRTDPWPAGTPCWVDLSVPDVEGAVAFYADVLGFIARGLWPHADPTFALLRRDEASVQFYVASRDPLEPVGNGTSLHEARNPRSAHDSDARPGTRPDQTADAPERSRLCASWVARLTRTQRSEARPLVPRR